MIRWVAVSLVAVASVGVGVARAQSTQAAPSRPVPEVSSTRTQNLSPREQLVESRRVISGMRNGRRSVANGLDNARRERDIIRINCLNDKLTQTDVTIRSTEEHTELLSNAAETNNTSQANHEFSLIQIYRQRAQTLGAEANQCIGGDDASGFGDRLELSVRTSAEIPSEELDLVPGTVIEVYVPPTMSPVM
ncbi:MAG: hypothetical protein Q8Q09_24020 [Deltaproteobacteria bacterium]|nr:hypothetical protein [Deltaproteobacteria bacterium]